METYLLECEPSDRGLINNFVENNGGSIVYFSPVLPIIGIKVIDEIKCEIERTFNLKYIMENPVGVLQDIEGTISSVPQNDIQIVPGLNFSLLRNSNLTGWGTTVAVLDSGVDETWVIEHQDFTGFGSTTLINHGTKVANIIRKAAPGAMIASFKVTQDGYIKATDVLQAIDAAVKKADIINMSMGFDVPCTAENPCVMCQYVNHYTQNEGKLFIVAAGNKGTGESTIQCPGNSQEAVTVGSIKPYSMEIADFSSRGVPGIKKPNILSSGTIYFNHIPDHGTSYSTPVISGVCATFFPFLTKGVSEMKSYLYSSTRNIGLPEHHQGFGLLDLEKLLEVFMNAQNYDTSKGQEQG
ncbi:S8 family serine peptidase [Bacillus sp. ISL-34]|uniref:S8 family peptidase n=1 Tax=Bacillus sp. ISL-34 TaxID=2819121 RepID=UPI001BEAE555|nr:S8 family serine peptidase [Bacillus sp. ISL-34]MBT2650029.1 S8 family serine peptidase [Bacillus sp. ISL-34]